jgi:ribosomal protein S18 acetylase RimI-like enzyme
VGNTLANGTELRPAEEGDAVFLDRVYASTRVEELALVDWDQATKDAFLAMQSAAQMRYYRQVYPDADYLIVTVDGHPAGRLYVARLPDEIRLVDVALLPEYRGRGIGTALISGVLAEARAADKVVRVHVEIFNRAMRLYERLGFGKVEERGVYWLLEWSPARGGS